MNKKISLFLTAILFINLQAEAVEYLSPRSLALGGAGRAAPLLNDGIYLNPSYASFLPTYNISGGYTWFDGGRNYNAAIQDSRTEMFQAGVGFTRREQNAAINIGASKLAIQSMGVGIGAKIIMDDLTKKMTTDSIFSTTYIVSPVFTSAFVIDNVFQSDSSLSNHLYRTFYFGMRYKTLDVVQIYIDPFYSPSYSGGKKAGASVGVEMGIMADFFIRLGKFYNAEIPYLDTRGSGFGLGLGWVGPRLSLDYAYHSVTKNDRLPGLTKAHGISLTLFF